MAPPDDVPQPLLDVVGSRDEPTLDDDALVGFELISLGPGTGDNFRFVLHRDGRLFAAANDPAATDGSEGPFNVPLPTTPTSTVPDEVVAYIEQLLTDDLQRLDGYVGDEAVRGGQLLIVTARHDGGVRELWYRNTSTDLTDALWNLFTEEATEPSNLDELYAQFAEPGDGE